MGACRGSPAQSSHRQHSLVFDIIPHAPLPAKRIHSLTFLGRRALRFRSCMPIGSSVNRIFSSENSRLWHQSERYSGACGSAALGAWRAAQAQPAWAKHHSSSSTSEMLTPFAGASENAPAGNSSHGTASEDDEKRAQSGGRLLLLLCARAVSSSRVVAVRSAMLPLLVLHHPNDIWICS